MDRFTERAGSAKRLHRLLQRTARSRVGRCVGLSMDIHRKPIIWRASEVAVSFGRSVIRVFYLVKSHG
jgi:hypothetical protein